MNAFLSSSKQGFSIFVSRRLSWCLNALLILRLPFDSLAPGPTSPLLFGVHRGLLFLLHGECRSHNRGSNFFKCISAGIYSQEIWRKPWVRGAGSANGPAKAIVCARYPENQYQASSITVLGTHSPRVPARKLKSRPYIQ